MGKKRCTKKIIPKKQKCNYCYIELPSQKAKWYHVRKEHTSFECNMCDKICTSLSNLQVHMVIHTGEKRYKCEVCSTEFAHSGSLKRHMLNYHNPLKTSMFHCKVCDKFYPIKREYENHLDTHTDKRPFSCKLCPSKTYKSDSGLRMHNESVHNPDKKFKCEQCPMKFVNKSRLKSHMVTHDQTKRFKCSLCKFASKLYGGLKRHVKIMHANIKDNECVFCGSTHSSPGNLKQHILRHVKERPYFCSLCDMSFPATNALRFHMTSHTGERAFKCEICGECYPYPKSLSRHMQARHGL